MIEPLIALIPTLAPTVIGAIVDLIRGHPDTTAEQLVRLQVAIDAGVMLNAQWEAGMPKVPVVADPPNAISGNE